MMQLHPSPSRSSSRTRSFLLLALIMLALQASVAVPRSQADPKPKLHIDQLKLVPTITSVVIQNGQLFANGFVSVRLKNETTTVPISGVPINISLAPNQPPGLACPILDLTLGPIELNLLGLVVETSPICLQITAVPGALLGDLLCNIGTLLNGGLSLSDILNGLGITDPISGVVIVLA